MHVFYLHGLHVYMYNVHCIVTSAIQFITVTLTTGYWSSQASYREILTCREREREREGFLCFLVALSVGVSVVCFSCEFVCQRNV